MTFIKKLKYISALIIIAILSTLSGMAYQKHEILNRVDVQSISELEKHVWAVQYLKRDYRCKKMETGSFYFSKFEWPGCIPDKGLSVAQYNDLFTRQHRSNRGAKALKSFKDKWDAELDQNEQKAMSRAKAIYKIKEHELKLKQK